MELFNIFTETKQPSFSVYSDGSVIFCRGIICYACPVMTQCYHEKTGMPKLTEEEFASVVEDNPEYLI
jgi:hypothetical protein